MKMPEMKQEISIPQGVEAKVAGAVLSVKGSKGEVKREFRSNRIKLNVAEGKVNLVAKNGTKKDKTMMGTFKAHIKNMVKGVTEGHSYQLKICSGHFPMNVTMKGKEFSVKNYLGEKVPRILTLKEGANVVIDGELITVSGNDIEICGQCAADIEKLTKITNRDRRIFQDGIWIISKKGK